jgi:hypothetical protein
VHTKKAQTQADGSKAHPQVCGVVVATLPATATATAAVAVAVAALVDLKSVDQLKDSIDRAWFLTGIHDVKYT